MVFKNICFLVHWTKVVFALKGLNQHCGEDPENITLKSLVSSDSSMVIDDHFRSQKKRAKYLKSLKRLVSGCAPLSMRLPVCVNGDMGKKTADITRQIEGAADGLFGEYKIMQKPEK